MSAPGATGVTSLSGVPLIAAPIAMRTRHAGMARLRFPDLDVR